MSEETDMNDNVIRKQLIVKLKSEADDFYNQLVVNRPRGKMSENLFINYFLPYLTGMTPIPEGIEVLSEWVTIAGSPTSEIEILDDITSEVLFITPSLYHTGIIDTSKREPGESFSDIISQYELQLKALPIIADKYLNGELNKKIQAIGEHDAIGVNSILTWNTILDRYGYLSPNNTKDIPSIDLDIEYD